jgi:hypothetical protein
VNHVFRIIKLVFLVLSILLCLAIPVAGIISTLTSWEGICYGFTDGQHDCPWWEYVRTEMFWASFLFIPLLFGAAVVWLGMSAVQFVMAMVKKRKESTTPPNMPF